jgi:hypothetical protein
MSDHDFETSFRAWSRAEAEDPVSDDFRGRVVAIPSSTSPQRSSLPRIDTGRLQSMFSATKFVVAGGIVALFGGFLLAGVLTTQPSEESMPAVGASASAQAEPTTETTAEPEPTSKSVVAEQTDTTTLSDLVPGVDLEVIEVRPGIYRVVSDGEHDLRKNVWDVAVAPDGGVWLEKHRITYEKAGGQPGLRGRSRDARVLRLGEPGISFEVDADDGLAHPDGSGARGEEAHLDVIDGKPIVAGPEIKRRFWDGQRWRLASGANLHCSDRVMEADGTCWHGSGKPNKKGTWEVPEVRVDPADGTRQIVTRDDLGLGPDNYFGWNIVLSEDGTVWTDIWDLPSDSSLPPVFAGLATYDGDGWTLFESSDASVARIERLAVAPDGNVWVVGVTPEVLDSGGLIAWAWDGETWAEVGSLGTDPGGLDVHFAPDGTVWFDPLTYFDGTMIRHLEVPASGSSTSPRIGSFSYAPDGAVWTVVVDMRTPEELGCQANPRVCQGVPDGLYVITPEAVAATE